MEQNDTLTQLTENADVAEDKSKTAEKEYTQAVKVLNAAVRAEKKAREALLEARASEVAALREVIEELTKPASVKDVESVPVETHEPTTPDTV